MTKIIPETEAPLDICWDKMGVAHVFARSTLDAFRGMGYACASERLWQLHLSNLYATGTAASVMGERFVAQDLMHQAFNVPAYDMPSSPGDEIVDAYLQGINAYIANLDEVPPEFVKAGTEPRFVTRHDVASRYRFTGWFQHKTWLEKIYLGQLMASHGVDWFRRHVRRFSAEDENNLLLMKDDLLNIDLDIARLLVPNIPGFDNVNTNAQDPLKQGPTTGSSGSNNWAISAGLSASGFPMLATDPHQPHGIPNTFFYSHLSAPGWDAFGSSFPGVPYFMMGFNQDISFGLTTGCIDTYDVFVEKKPTTKSQSYTLDVAGQGSKTFEVESTKHGPILESISNALGITKKSEQQSTTALDWVMRDLPTSAGALALMPLAKTSKALGEALFENDLCPLVNNIICVDKDNDMRRFVAATVRKRTGVTGIVPIPGGPEEYYFDTSKADELTVEHNPESGYLLTANNDTMGDSGEYPIHNFPIHSARADRIEQLLKQTKSGFTAAHFTEMQLDLLDLRAKQEVPYLVGLLNNSGDDSEEVIQASALLADWDCVASTDSKAACIYYTLLDRAWSTRFMRAVLGEDVRLKTMRLVAPSLHQFSFSDFCRSDSPWMDHKSRLQEIVCGQVLDIMQLLKANHGDDWDWGTLHQISFKHSLAKFDTWQDMKVGPDPIGGSPTTLAMTVHNPPKKGSLIQHVYHGPAYRWVTDLADQMHFKFVIAGGNGGRPDSPYVSNHYDSWLHGEYFDMTLVRDEIEVELQVSL